MNHDKHEGGHGRLAAECVNANRPSKTNIYRRQEHSSTRDGFPKKSEGLLTGIFEQAGM